MMQAGQGILSDKVMPDQTPKGSEGVSQAGTRKRVPGREEATRSLAGLRMDGRDPPRQLPPVRLGHPLHWPY